MIVAERDRTSGESAMFINDASVGTDLKASNTKTSSSRENALHHCPSESSVKSSFSATPLGPGPFKTRSHSHGRLGVYSTRVADDTRSSTTLAPSMSNEVYELAMARRATTTHAPVRCVRSPATRSRVALQTQSKGKPEGGNTEFL